MANFDLQILKQLKSLFPTETKTGNNQPTVEINADTLFETAFFLTINSAANGSSLDLTESGAIDKDETTNDKTDITEDKDFATEFKNNLLELIQSLTGKNQVDKTEETNNNQTVEDNTQNDAANNVNADATLAEKLQNFSKAIESLMQILQEKFGTDTENKTEDKTNIENGTNNSTATDNSTKLQEALMKLLDKMLNANKTEETEEDQTNADGSTLKTEDLVGADLEEFEKIASQSPAFQALIEACGADKVFEMLDEDGDGKLSDAELAKVAGLDGNAEDISMDDFLMNLISKMMGEGGLEEITGEDDAGEEAGNQVGDAIKGALGAFIGFEAIQAGIDKLKELGAAALELAGISENSGKKFSANFTEEDAEWAENFGSSIHRTKSEIQSFMVSNKALYGEMGITGEAATELSKATTSLAYDFGNAFSMDDTEALGVVQDYLSGNSAALEEYGVHIDDTVLKNTALAMGLGENIDELDDAAMAQVRMNALLQESSSIQQAAVKDTGGLINSTKSLKGIWNEFMADAGAKFAPAMEGLFGTVLNNWPMIEPMLMGFVDVLSNGMGQAVPVLMNLGSTLIPTLTSVLGTLFEAGTPLISVFGEIAQTVLPPFAQILGTLGSTLLPPVTSILSTLNESVLQPLMPVLGTVANSLLPPIASLLEELSPVLEWIEPPLELIGKAVGVIAEGLGSVIEFLGSGVGAAVDFFDGFFGGAEESKKGVDELGSSLNTLAGTQDEIGSAPIGIDLNDDQPKPEPKPSPTSTGSNVLGISDEVDKEKKEVGSALDSIFEQTEQTYQKMEEQSSTSWSHMVDDAQEATSKITSLIKSMSSAMSNVPSLDMQLNIPHHADGTDSFEGGFTWMNEEGGELAFLPSGTAILPADRSEQLLDNVVNNVVNNEEQNRQLSFAPIIQIDVNGQLNEEMIAKLKEICRDVPAGSDC